MKQLKRMLACVIAAAVAIPTVAASLPATAAEQDSSISMVDKFRNPDNQAQGTVSYTHLDVYKRQQQHRRQLHQRQPWFLIQSPYS